MLYYLKLPPPGIINLAIGAQISNVEEAAQVEAIRAQQSREQARLKEKGTNKIVEID